MHGKSTAGMAGILLLGQLECGPYTAEKNYDLEINGSKAHATARTFRNGHIKSYEALFKSSSNPRISRAESYVNTDDRQEIPKIGWIAVECTVYFTGGKVEETSYYKRDLDDPSKWVVFAGYPHCPMPLDSNDTLNKTRDALKEAIGRK